MQQQQLVGPTPKSCLRPGFRKKITIFLKGKSYFLEQRIPYLYVLCDQTKQNGTNVKQPLLRRKKTIPDPENKQGYILHPNDII